MGAEQQAAAPARRSRVLSRAEEFETIKADLRRLSIILVVMAVLLIVATIILR
jgi:hypothetical protein